MRRYPGLLVYVVGPSGAGKDSLMAFAGRCLAGRNDAGDSVCFVRRHITRPAGDGNEDHIPVTDEEFRHYAQRGDFILSWESHGLRYGVHKSMLTVLEQGRVAVLNGSRAYAEEAAKRISPMLVLEVTARPEVLRQRLEQRGREQGADIEERLARAAMPLPLLTQGAPHVRLDNSGNMENAGKAFAEVLRHARDYAG